MSPLHLSSTVLPQARLASINISQQLKLKMSDVKMDFNSSKLNAQGTASFPFT